MSDKFHPIPMESLAGWIFGELQAHDSIFGLPRDLFFTPRPRDPFTQRVYGQFLETPFGVAAGPHSQMAQNLVMAWLCGARFMELKTVQTLDELNVSKPCIDMPDAGYNVEWSQELKVEESLDEYARAWVLIHALHRKFDFPGARPGINFNLSVGYNMAGLLQPNMQAFLKGVRDIGGRRQRLVEIVARHVPEVRDIEIPDLLSDNVTLSTMHGCPPEEIGRISRYLMEEWGLHTSVKLNPTLLGPDAVRDILNRRLGYDDIEVPDSAFEHDLKYADAVPMLRELHEVARQRGVVFGVKLSNTLEVLNRRKTFSESETCMYLSGRPLHALTAHLAARLAEEFDGELLLSFAGGADAFNVADLLACGISTITACSDLLRPGGYTRMLQYIENTRAAMKARRARTLAELVRRTGRGRPVDNLRDYARGTLAGRLYRKDAFRRDGVKTARALGPFDCIKAPCTDQCAVQQKVPQYMRLIREGRPDEAIEVTRADNPLPTILGRACNHPCETVCMRTHYDEPLAIREIKRYILDQERAPRARRKAKPREARVAVIGGGPCGLSVAYFLAQAGYPVTIFESRARAGGMVSGTIPGYRASNDAVVKDIGLIEKLGVEFRFGQCAGRDFTLADLKRAGFRYTVIATGAQLGARLGIPGEDAAGVLDALDFLRAARAGRPPLIGERVGVIGGGDVAMDCARTAWRLQSRHVEVIYRRTRREMPAEPEEVEGLLQEGIAIRELTAPKRVVSRDGKLAALVCVRMVLGPPDASGRRRPVEVPDSEFEIPLDTLIVAVSQKPDLSFFGDEAPARTESGFLRTDPATLETSLPGIFAGGDIGPGGPATIVCALGDGRRIARAIRAREGDPEEHPDSGPGQHPDLDLTGFARRRSWRLFREPVPHREAAQRRDFEEVVQTFSEDAAAREAARCLDCDQLCSFCAGVCPNLAISTYRSRPIRLDVPRVAWREGRWHPVGCDPFRVNQAFQVTVLTDFCNECGNCVTFCPTAGRPWHDKPRLYLHRPDFEAQTDNAYRVFHNGRTWSMQGRFAGSTHEIAWNGSLTYTSPKLVAVLDPSTFELRSAKGEAADGDVSLLPCAQMFALLRGIKESLPFLPTAKPEAP